MKISRLRHAPEREGRVISLLLERTLRDFNDPSLSPGLLLSNELWNKLLSELIAALGAPPSAPSASSHSPLASSATAAHSLLSLIFRVTSFSFSFSFS